MGNVHNNFSPTVRSRSAKMEFFINNAPSKMNYRFYIQEMSDTGEQSLL